MKTIYKSIALEAALLSVTLALQAEIQSEGETVTADVQANTLDRLKVTLVSPNVSGARDLVAAGNATIEGNEISVNLENLAFGTHRLIVSARFGTQIRTLYALDIYVPQAELPNETQEYEDAAIVVSTYGDGGGGGEFPTDYAKQGDDPTATLTDTQAYAQAAAEAAQSLTSLDSDINAGKTAIAQAVTAKGVPTSPTDTMLQMATNVTQIAQAPISINGGEMYAKQLYGSLTTPNYWNLYEVMAQLLSDGRLNNYGGILLAEYYKGYDSLALSGAGAGGAYVVSDVDNNGNFILYTEDTTHVWNTEFDGKGNRWVAYCFNDEYHDFQITDTNTSPRSIFICRKVGTITCLTDNRTSKIVIPDGNDLIAYDGNNFVPNFDSIFILRNCGIKNTLLYRKSVEALYVELAHDNVGAIVQSHNTSGQGAKSLIVKSSIRLMNVVILDSQNQSAIAQTSYVTVDADGEYKLSPNLSIYRPDNLKELNIIAEDSRVQWFAYGTTIYHIPSTCLIYVNYRENDKSKSVSLTGIGFDQVQDLQLKSDWNKPLEVSSFESLTEANMYAHVLQRLKQDEPDCGDGVTITLGQTNLDKLTSQESIDLLDALTNTYGYTFA